jgi:hypothetical protein
MNTITEYNLNLAIDALRRAAAYALTNAPAVSVRASALATEIELRIKKLEALR